RLALLAAVAQAARALVGLPEHALAPAVALGVLGDGAVDDLDVAAGVLLDDAVLQWAVGGAHDLDLARRALDADRRAAGALAVDVAGDAQRRERDAVALVVGELHDD